MNTKKIIVIITVAAALVLASCAAPNVLRDQVINAFQAGDGYMAQNQFNMAIAEYQNSLTLLSQGDARYGSTESSRAYRTKLENRILAARESVGIIPTEEAAGNGQAVLVQAEGDGGKVPAPETPTVPKDEDFEVRQNPNNTLTITGYKGTAKNLIIPETLYGLTVTVIGGNAFWKKEINGVVIPDTVTTIQDGSRDNTTGFFAKGAFAENEQLVKVTLGKGLKTIGYGAFLGTGISEITIPDSVTSIGNSAFYGYDSGSTFGKLIHGKLSKVTFGAGIQTIGERAFSNNQIAELNLPPSLKIIEKSTFSGNKIQKITFGTEIQTIGEDAFSSNQIAELNLPLSLKEIRKGAFSNNQIQSVIIPNSVTWIESSLGTWNMVGYVDYGFAFADNPIKTVVIPESLAAKGRIGVRTFGPVERNTITRITVPAGIDESTLKNIFEASFVNFWISQNKAGGTFVKRGAIWTKE